jgi:hypothetical protein
MSRKKKLRGRLALTLLLVLCVVQGTTAAQSRRFRGHREFRSVTRNLPAIDRVELLRLKLDDHPQWNGDIAASKVLQGVEAQRVAALWRRQTFNQNLAACHEPNYAIKFYAQGRLLVYASICWSCNNIFFITPKSNRTQSFAGYDDRGEQLSEIFRLAFAQTE